MRGLLVSKARHCIARCVDVGNNPLKEGLYRPAAAFIAWSG
jgi:hypothetical protein